MIRQGGKEGMRVKDRCKEEEEEEEEEREIEIE